MTVKEFFESVLIELHKLEAPSLTLEEYNYFINKAISKYLKKRYNFDNVDQQITDDLHSLRTQVKIVIDPLTPTVGTPTSYTGNIADMYAAGTVAVTPTDEGILFLLPDNYWHLNSCIICFQSSADHKCFTQNSLFRKGARRLTEDAEANIQDNYYLKPHYRRPYYNISDNPADPIHVPNSNIVPGVNNAEIEVLTGSHPLFDIAEVKLKYLRLPKYIFLNYEDANNDTLAGSLADVSPVMEFPTPVCEEMVDAAVQFIMENASDGRTGAHAAINQAILPPQPGK
jgi:hypothetical protein